MKALAANEDLQDILARNLEVAIQNCIDIALHLCAAHGEVPATSSQTFLVLAERGLIKRDLTQRLQRAVGFRNLLMHEYAEVDWKIVMQVLRTGTRDLGEFGKAVLGLLQVSEAQATPRTEAGSALLRAARRSLTTIASFPCVRATPILNCGLPGNPIDWRLLCEMDNDFGLLVTQSLRVTSASCL